LKILKNIFHKRLQIKMRLVFVSERRILSSKNRIGLKDWGLIFKQHKKMKKLSLLLIVLMSFVRIGFGQDANPNVKPGEGKDEGCECGSKGINISTGFNNKANTLFGNNAVDNEWKIVSYPNGTGSINAVASNPANSYYALPSSTSEWLIPQNVTSGGSYTYQYTFIVPTGSEANLKFRRIGGDDDLVMKIDGDQVFTSGNGGWAFKEDRVILKKCLVVNKLSNGTRITAGTHIIECIVNNGSNGATGLLLDGCMDFVKVEAPVVVFEDTKCCIGTDAKNLSTGFGNSANSLIANGMADDDWKITSTPSGTAVAMVATSASVSPSYAPASAKAQWLIAKDKFDTGPFTFERTIVVPAGMEANLTFSRIGGDNQVEMTLISGANTTLIYKSNFPGDFGGLAFTPKNVILKSCTVAQRLAPGTHKIVCTVNNDNSAVGLLVEGCYELVQTVPECRCPAGWYSNTDQKDGGIIKGNDGCKKQVCVFDKALVPPKNGTVIGDPANPWGFTWENGFYVWGTKANGGAPICTLNGKVIDIEAYRATQGRGE
jgi:hypothetical protein